MDNEKEKIIKDFLFSASEMFRRKLSPVTISAYVSSWKSFKLPVLKELINEFYQQVEYFPVPAHLHKIAMNKLDNLVQKDVEKLEQEIDKMIRKGGRYADYRNLTDNQNIIKLIDIIGWDKICDIKEDEWKKEMEKIKERYKKILREENKNLIYEC